jgi:dipeptidyl-peptidase-4
MIMLSTQSLRGAIVALLVSLSFSAPAFGRALAPELEQRLEDIFEKRLYDTARQPAMQWLADGASYVTITRNTGGVPEFVRHDVATGAKETLFSLAQVKALAPDKTITYEGDFAVSGDGTRLLATLNGKRDAPTGAFELWLFERGKTVRKIATDAEYSDLPYAFSPDGGRIVYPHAHDLYVYDIERDTRTRLTHDGKAGDIGNAVGKWGSRVVRWSPDSARIAFVRNDFRKIGLFPLINNTEAVYPKPRFTRFPKVGTPIAVQRLGVVSVRGGPIRWVSFNGTPDSDYFGSIEWANANQLGVDRLIRPINKRDLFVVDARSGKATAIRHEEDRAWVQDIFARNTKFTWRKAGASFVWETEIDGWRRAYDIGADGSGLTPVTPPNVDVVETHSVDEANGWLYYVASPENATQRYLYRARLDGNGAERVTPQDQPGTHVYDIAPGGRFALHTYSTANTPPLIELIELPSHRVVRVLEDNSRLRERLAPLKPTPFEFAKVDIGDGVILDSWLLKPRNFDASKKYPILVFVYGEPAAQTVIDSWDIGHRHFHRAIADAGYVILSIDNRGTPAPKGTGWRRAIFPSQGPLSSREQAAALREVTRARTYLDAARVGIWGLSAGGTNTLNAMFRYPDQYHVGIAVAAKPRADLYNASFQEIFQHTPKDNPDGYRDGDALNFAAGLKGDLLIIHGTGEENTHLQIIEHLVNRLIELGKPFDYMTYPNRGHSLSEGQGTRKHMFKLIARYLTEHLQPGPR